MADTKTSALTQGTICDFFYGIQGGASRKYNGSGWVNVKDYGATGDGTTDDSTAINNAIAAAAALSTTTGGTKNGGTVFFPPGNYAVSANPVKNTVSGGYVRLVGSGKQTCGIVGSRAGFLIEMTDSSVGAIQSIQDMRVVNGQTSTGFDATVGAISFNGTQGGTLDNLLIGGWTGISAYSNCFNTTIKGCDFSGPSNATGSVGIYAGQIGIYQTSVLGYDVGMAVQNVGCVIHGSRVETTNMAIALGMDQTGSSGTSSSVSITGLSTERCNRGIKVISTTNSMISAAHTSGTSDVAGTGSAVNGLQILNAQGLVVSGFINSQKVSSAGIDCGSMTGSNITFIGCVSGVGGGAGAAWIMPETNATPTFYASDVQFINCNNPTAAIPFSNLPASPIEGMMFDVTDSNSATWGATAASGGSNHVRVRYNGTNWTVVGK